MYWYDRMETRCLYLVQVILWYYMRHYFRFRAIVIVFQILTNISDLLNCSSTNTYTYYPYIFLQREK